MLSVIAFRFKAVGKSCKNYRNITVCGKLYSLLKKCRVCIVRFTLISFGIGNVGIFCGAVKCV